VSAATVSGRLWLVGAGNMGGAMLSRWIASGVLAPGQVTVIDPGTPGLPDGVAHTAEWPAGVPDILVLGVKPQMLGDVAEDLARRVPPLVVSILAGVEEATLARVCGGGTVVRAMPNLPVALGRGVVALHSAGADDAARATVEALMAPLGLVEWLTDEAQFHALIAVSGSGPGFVYRFIAAMAESGAALGLPADQAQRLAIATVEGAAALAGSSDTTPDVLADRVASPGGTTRAGLDVLDRDDALRRLIAATLTATADRSEELATASRS
jgi:pyrroline-5-carboxylate reductase